MKIFFPKESENESRSALDLASAQRLIDLGIEVSFESGVTQKIDISDQDLEDIGCKNKSRSEGLSNSEIISSVNHLPLPDLDSVSEKTLTISFLDVFNEKEFLEKLRQKNITSISMELIPRITRAQKMDALSSQANLAGYSAVMLASSEMNKAMPMMMTAAGTISPARVFVIGVGVAGLQAMATAKRLGARVEAFDTRPVVEEQVKSLGARFIKIDIGETEETDQGYAKELTEKQLELQREGMKKVCGYSDIVITTAQVFGKPAPRILSEDMVSSMQPGSIIVDMAVTSGGNVEGSVLGEIVERNGVKIIGHENLPGYVPEHSTQVYASNIYNLIEEFWDKDAKKLELDESDEILKSCIVTKDGNYISEILRS